jgi:hypothetical protein
MRELWAALRGLIVDTVIESRDALTDRVKATWAGRRITPNVEPLFPQGVWFGVPGDARGVLFSPLGDPSRAKALVQGTGPSNVTPAVDGEGGLHYLGAWRVWVADGVVILGGGPDDASELLVRADRLQTELDAIKTYLDAHVHTGVTTGPGSSGVPAGLMPAPGNAACDKVKGI